MKRSSARILTVNGGSSSIKFALFEASTDLRRTMAGQIERIGSDSARLLAEGPELHDSVSREIAAPDHKAAVGVLVDWLQELLGHDQVAAVGHRVVHGGPKYSEAQRITAEMVEELHALEPFDPEHLPEEIQLTEAFFEHFPGIPQVAC